MEIKIITQSLSLDELKDFAEQGFGDFVKAVVDVEKRIMALGGELHADEEAGLLDNNSRQEHLWGINLYPKHHGTNEWLEFDSFINIRPNQGNRSREIEDGTLKKKIRDIVDELIN